MTANSTTPSAPVSFEVLLAKMQPYFRKYAKRFSPDKRLNRDDVMQDLTGIALEMYTSLVRRGKEVFYSPLAIYAIKRYSSGRRFTGLNSTDVHSKEGAKALSCQFCQQTSFFRTK